MKRKRPSKSSGNGGPAEGWNARPQPDPHSFPPHDTSEFDQFLPPSVREQLWDDDSRPVLGETIPPDVPGATFRSPGRTQREIWESLHPRWLQANGFSYLLEELNAWYASPDRSTLMPGVMERVAWLEDALARTTAGLAESGAEQGKMADYIARQEEFIRQQAAKIDQQNASIENHRAAVDKANAALAEQNITASRLQATIGELNATIEDHQATAGKLHAEMREKTDTAERLEARIAGLNSEIERKDATIERLRSEAARQQAKPLTDDGRAELPAAYHEQTAAQQADLIRDLAAENQKLRDRVGQLQEKNDDLGDRLLADDRMAPLARGGADA